MKNLQRVACYCRVSTEEQVKFGFSIQAQKDALEKYCKQNKYKYDFYVDEGISASSMKKRNALKEMLSKVNVYDMILFTKLDRLSRNVLDANNINKTLIENNCVMKAIDEDDIDTSTADGTFIFNLKVSLAQREIEKTSERIKFVFKNKREKGEVTSGQKKYCYDIVDKKWVINKEEANNMIALYKEFIKNNGSYIETMPYFIEHFPGKGLDAFKGYLRDTSYIGKYKLYRQNTYLDDYIPPIMDEGLFYSVQELLRKKGHSKPADKVGLFTGLLCCSYCNGNFTKMVDHRTKRLTVRYRCHNSSVYFLGTMKSKCDFKSTVREEFIEEYLLNNLKELVKDYIKANEIQISKINKTDNSDKIKKLQKKIEKLKDLYIDDLIDKETYKKDYSKYTKEIDELKIKTDDIKPKDFTFLKELINKDIDTIYNSLTREEKRFFWLNIIDKIYLKYPEITRVDFVCN